MLFVQALYFAATVINRNALINRDTSSTKQNVERGILAGGAQHAAKWIGADRNGAERSEAERKGMRTSSRRINHFNSCCVALAAADKTNERRGAC